MKLIYQFTAGHSRLHGLDPRTKLLLVLIALVLSFATGYPWFVFAGVLAILWLFGRIHPGQYWPFLVMLAPIMAAVFLVHRSVRGLEIGFRLAAMGVAFLGFSMTTDPFDFGLALHRSGAPYRISFMIAFALRFFPLLHEEMTIIRNALRARGYEGWGTVALTALPLGLGALRRSQRIALAMELRGFSYARDLHIQRTHLRDVRMRAADYVAILLGLGLLLAVVWPV